MKLLTLIFTVFSATVTLAAAPGPYQVAASILNDSGMGDATNVAGTHVGSDRVGSDTETTHILHFNHDGESYTCDFVVLSRQIRTDNYVVEAQMSGCRSASGASLRLNNDYTNSAGVTSFTRLFYNNNTRFRPLTSDERELASNNGGRMVDSNVRVLNPRNSDRVILNVDGQIIPIN